MGGDPFPPDRPCGFLFAFKAYSRSHEHSVYGSIEAVVHLLTASDIIHVEMVPVMGRSLHPTLGHLELVAADSSFTALMGEGFCEHPAAECMDSSFVLLFVPLTSMETADGISFLHSMRGKSYNYASLPLTVLPGWVKRTACAGGGGAVEFGPRRVFCSQVGLLLCHACGLLLHSEEAPSEDPSLCTPGELYTILVHRLGACPWARGGVQIRVDINSDSLFSALTAPPGAPAFGGEGRVIRLC